MRARAEGSFSVAAGVLTVCALLLCGELRSEVFLLRPLPASGADKASPLPLAPALPGLENASPLLREPVRINGKAFTLELFRSGAAFDEMRAFLLKKGVRFAASGDTLRCTARLPGGSLERLLIVRSPGMGPVTVFRIAGPPGIPPVGSWPRDLPDLPPGAKPLQVMELSKSSSVYGVFEDVPQDAGSAFRAVDTSLRAQGWLPAGNEGSPLIGGNGDIYFSRKANRILWVTFDGGGRGAFYSRSLNSRGEMPRSL